MCGIVGKAGKNVKKDSELLRRMRDTLAHRGPDDAGDWWSEDGTVGLAMRRLAIIDLSPSGHQPMLDRKKELVIIFNGEIYNYKELTKELRSKGHEFSSASDTEVILEAYREWQTGMVEHLIGMFALAIYDIRRNILFIARDRAGEKPLYYLHEPGVMRFGSELKSILADGTVNRRIDETALQYYLSFGYVPGGLCILENFKKLPPAHAMTYDLSNDTIKVWQYWSLPDPAPGPPRDEEELLLELETLLEDAVKRQLIADVPVGIMLSGGIDSSLVTAMASRTSSEKIRTYTVTFPGFGKFNEGPYARQVAEYFGTSHTELEAGSVEPGIMIELARQYDEPIADSSMIPTFMISKLIRKYATVALGGDGGDELFGGYNHYSLLLATRGIRASLPSSLKRLLKSTISAVIPPGFPYKDKAIVRVAEDPHYYLRTDIYFDTKMIRKILRVQPKNLVDCEEKSMYHTLGRHSDRYSLLQQTMSIDFLNYLPSDVLVKVDRASMLASLEVRAPFLDHRVVEFAYRSVPDQMKATETDRKILLKRLAKKVLPSTLDVERKQGFSIPLGDWFRTGWGKFMNDVLLDDSQSLFDKKTVSRLSKLQSRGIFNYQRLFALTMFQLWIKEYRVQL